MMKRGGRESRTSTYNVLLLACDMGIGWDDDWRVHHDRRIAGWL